MTGLADTVRRSGRSTAMVATDGDMNDLQFSNKILMAATSTDKAAFQTTASTNKRIKN